MPTSSEPPDDVAIEVDGLGKAYRVAGARHDTLRDMLASSVKGALGTRSTSEAKTFWALKGVSFKVRHGENVGVLGLNGAGKSTLLKLLSRVTDPTRGRARITGRLSSLLEVGTGFHGELTGRENIFLYAAILGMSKAEVSARFDEIVTFADIEGFVDVPVKRYSSGMYVRLAFSVAAHMNPDILLLDEVLSVGDLPFQRKCMEFAKGLQKRRATILFVSHNMFSIKTMCDRVIYLRHGRVAFDGPTEEGIALYEADCRLGAVSWAGAEGVEGPIGVTGVQVMDEAGRPKSVFDHGERLRLRVAYAAKDPIESPGFVVAFIRSDGVACCSYSSELDGLTVDVPAGGGVIDLLTPPLSLVSELYRIEILVRAKGFQKLLCAQTGGVFHVRHPVLDLHFGVFHEAGVWAADEAPVRKAALVQAAGAGR